MKKIETFISITVSILVFAFSLFFFILEKKDFSVNENRYLSSFPQYSFLSLKSGKYTNTIKDYLTDHFPFRDFMVSLKTTSYKFLGIKKINGVYLSKDGYLIEEFNGIDNLDKIVEKINNFQEKIGFKVNVLLAPTSILINEEKLPKYSITLDETVYINKFYNKLQTNNISIIEELLANKNKYQLYYKLDHHWTSYGAYIAYLKFCEHLNIEPIDDYEIKKVSDSFYGTLYSKTNDYSLKPDDIHIFKTNGDYEVIYDDKNITNTLYEESYLTKKDKYSYFLNNNHGKIEITNKNVKTGNLLIIKDSYANSFVPFVSNNYHKIYVFDPRYYKGTISDFVLENKIDNVLFLYNLNTIDNDLGILSIK